MPLKAKGKASPSPSSPSLGTRFFEGFMAFLGFHGCFGENRVAAITAPVRYARRYVAGRLSPRSFRAQRAAGRRAVPGGPARPAAGRDR